MRRQLAFLLSVMVLMGAAVTARADIAIDFTSNNIFLVDHYPNDVTGFRFRVGETPLRVTELGFWDEDADGLVESHPVGIYQTFAAGTPLIVSAEVPGGTDATLEGLWRFVPITPTVLSANTTYSLLAYRTTAGDGVAYNVLGHTITPSIDFVTEQFGNDTGGLQFVDEQSFAFPPDRGWFGPNFKFEEVPEPASFALLSVGLLCLGGWLWRRQKRA